MDKAKALQLIELAKRANVERWFVRRPTPEMIERFGDQGLHPFIEQRKVKGEVTGVEVLAEDYSGNDDLREAHLAFIMAAAENVVELAQAVIDAADREEDRRHEAMERNLQD